MNSRLATLRRLLSLYGEMEEMYSLELQRTVAAVGEANEAIDEQKRLVRSSSFIGRGAMIAGDRLELAASRTQGEIAEWKQERLQQVRLERERLSDEARMQYHASRVRSEQIQQVVDDAAAQIAAKTGRQMQAANDDRFLARRRWSDTREELRTKSEMNNS